jgi:hypothetical protein
VRVLSAAILAATLGGNLPVPLPLFPPNNWWNIDVSNAPVAGNSNDLITFVGGSNRQIHPDFGDVYNGHIIGFPYVVVDGSQAKKTVTFDVPEESDGVNHDTETSYPFYPIPDEAITQSGWIEYGDPGNVDSRGDADRHILIVDSTNNHLYEIYNVWHNGTSWEAYSGAFFDMNTNNRRPDGWTSADAAGLAILPGLVRYDEVYGPDEINHAFRVTVSSTNNYYAFPASHVAGSNTSAPPFGTRFRLKASKDITGFSAPMQKIFRAMQKYGLIVADNGSNMFVSGTHDTRWDGDVLVPAFHALKASDFEVIQLGWKPAYTLVVTIASPTGSGDATTVTVTAYDANYNLATGYAGTIHFTSSDLAATLPSNYTFTGGDAGTHTFPLTLRTTGRQTVTATDTVDPTVVGLRTVSVGPAAPASLVATATSTAQVALTWSASTGAASYQISRLSASSPLAVIGTSNTTSYNDNTVTAGASWLYKVRALDASSNASGYSPADAATTIMFTDDPLAAGSTKVKAVHLTELRQAVNAMRAAASLGSTSFTDASPAGVNIKTVHINELRTSLAAARSALGLSALAFTDSSLSAYTSTVRAVHFTELRNGVK